jgi:hypothetical protein
VDNARIWAKGYACGVFSVMLDHALTNDSFGYNDHSMIMPPPTLEDDIASAAQQQCSSYESVYWFTQYARHFTGVIFHQANLLLAHVTDNKAREDILRGFVLGLSQVN